MCNHECKRAYILRIALCALCCARHLWQFLVPFLKKTQIPHFDSSEMSSCCSNTVCCRMAAEHRSSVKRESDLVLSSDQSNTWQISICRFYLCHFKAPFSYNLSLMCIYKGIKLYNVCASKGSTKKPTRDLVSHCLKSWYKLRLKIM